MYLGKALTAGLARLDRPGSTSFWKTTLVPRTELDLQPLRIYKKKKTKKKHTTLLRGRETHEASSFL